MDARARFTWGLTALAIVTGPAVAAQELSRRQLERIEQTLRQEGQAVVALADLAADGERLPADFALSWHNDFFKAQTGTFVPFIVSIRARDGQAAALLLYIRAARREPAAEGARRSGPRRPAAAGVVYPFEEIYPVAVPAGGIPARVTRGFALPPGSFDLTVVVRERGREDGRERRRLAAVLRQPISVPDYGDGELTTSTVILADRLTVLAAAPPSTELLDRPYIIGSREIEPAEDAVFRPSEELVVVFLVYNPTVTPAKHFDLEVEYHFFRKGARDTGPADQGTAVPDGLIALPGERYFNRTEPQRFNPLSLGPDYEPGEGQPVMAGQGVPLAGFRHGDYRLSIKVKDLVSGRSILRDVTFTVRP